MSGVWETAKMYISSRHRSSLMRARGRRGGGLRRTCSSNASADGNAVYFAASLGGHLELLEAVARGLGPSVPSRWVSVSGPRCDALAAEGAKVDVLEPLDRHQLSVRSLVSGVLLAIQRRPRFVVTSGAGVVVPFCAVARLLGARVLFVETMARVTSGSIAGRIVGRFSEKVLVQWPEMKSVYPTATVCAPLLLMGRGRFGPELCSGAGQGGTFVSVGSHPVPFVRLGRAVERAISDGILPLPILAQLGPMGIASPQAAVVPSLEPAEFAAAVGGHDVIVCHGGAGVVATAIGYGKRPVVVPRSAVHGEHVDDHQEELAKKLDDLGLIVRVDETISAEHVARARTLTTSELSVGSDLPSVCDEVRTWLQQCGLPGLRGSSR